MDCSVFHYIGVSKRKTSTASLAKGKAGQRTCGTSQSASDGCNPHDNSEKSVKICVDPWLVSMSISSESLN